MKYDKIHELKIEDRNTLKGMSKKKSKNIVHCALVF